jgi:hypothetical protein
MGLRIGLGLFGVLLGAHWGLTWPQGYYLYPVAIVYLVVSLYILISAFIPWIRWPPSDRNG